MSHRIGVRVVNGVGEFYDRSTGDTFIPRGNNYVRLANAVFCSGGYVGQYHAVFDVGKYDPALTQQELGHMHQSGYNTVRVFLNNCCTTGIGDPAGGLSAGYLDNVADFLRKAKANQIYVILTIDDLPELGGYKQSFGSTSQVYVANASYMLSAGVAANRRFWQDFIEGLVARNVPLDAIFAYELRNEMYFWGTTIPFTLTSGRVTIADGDSFDMSVFDDKKKMLDESLVYWSDQVKGAILQVDPTALVTIGFFSPDHPNPSIGFAGRTIRTYAAIAPPSIGGSSIDYVDLHAYPVDYPLSSLVQGFEMPGLTSKPILMGEFGAFQGAYATNSFAADDVLDWQLQSCQFGFGGWLFWTWDSSEQAGLWNALSGGGLIDQALSPQNRADPCAYSQTNSANLSLNQPVVATSAQSGHPASNAVDGVTGDYWAPSGLTGQSVQVDLGGARTVSRIRLVLYQSQNGNTDIRIWGRPPGGTEQLLKEWVGATYDRELLDYLIPAPVAGIEFVRAEIASGPSNSGWREIEFR